MPLVYSLVARGTTVLAEYATTSGTFTEVTRRLLAKLRQQQGTRMSYVYDQHVFHYKMDQDLVYLCLADEVSMRTERGRTQHCRSSADTASHMTCNLSVSISSCINVSCMHHRHLAASFHSRFWMTLRIDGDQCMAIVDRLLLLLE
jgi:hypothetical protein